MVERNDQQESWHTVSLYPLLTGVIVVAAFGGIVWLVVSSQIGGWDFRNNLWAPAHLLLQRESPYNLSPFYDLGGAVWLPMVIGALFPLGALPLAQAAMLWRIVSLGSIVGLVWLVAEQKRPLLVPFMVGILTVVLYPRTIAHLQLGQFTLLATLLYILSVGLLQKQFIGLPALFVALALTKPQLGLLTVVGLTIMVYRLQKWRGVVYFLTAVVAWCGILTVPLFLFYPGWIPDFVLALRHNPTWVQPSLFSLLPIWWGWPGRIIWGLLFVVVMVINGRLWWQRPGLQSLCWSLALTTLVTPYIWSWDFVLLLPLFVWGLFHFQLLAARILLLLGYLVNWFLMMRVILISDGSDHHFWWGSWLLFLLIVAGSWLEGRHATVAN
jgi:hypothetical protein